VSPNHLLFEACEARFGVFSFRLPALVLSDVYRRNVLQSSGNSDRLARQNCIYRPGGLIFCSFVALRYARLVSFVSCDNQSTIVGKEEKSNQLFHSQGRPRAISCNSISHTFRLNTQTKGNQLTTLPRAWMRPETLERKANSLTLTDERRGKRRKKWKRYLLFFNLLWACTCVPTCTTLKDIEFS
jgi:hypothetical protein